MLWFLQNPREETPTSQLLSLHPDLQVGWLCTCLCENGLDWALGDRVQAKCSLDVVGAVLAGVHRALLTLWREGLDVTLQLFGTEDVEETDVRP